MVNALAATGDMKLAWYLNRLRNMEPEEILHRAHEAALKAISRHRPPGWKDYRAGDLSSVFPGLRRRIKDASPEQRQTIAAAATKAISGEFTALGISWPKRDPNRLYPQDLWRLDPVTGTAWPGAETYTFDIDYRHRAGRGDIKHVWEIARLQQLPILSAQALLSDDVRAIATIETAIASWHEANPPFQGTGWASGIEVALRAISLIITRDLVSDRLSAGCVARIAQILAASDYWLKRFPSKFSSANNHLIAELAGQYLIGLALGGSTRDAEDALKFESLKQFFADGCGAEQSPTYAAFSAEFLLLCMLAAEERGSSFGAATEGRLSAFADFIDWLPEGSGFGDDDEGRVVSPGDETGYQRSVAAAICGFLKLDGPMADPGDFRSLFFGKPTVGTARRSGFRIFENGGISVWRGDMAGRRAELTFDHGPLGYLSIAAHGHADALSITLQIDHQPVLVDPGTWLYGSGGIWRNWFRSTPAHNCLNIEGESQSVMSGAFNWSHKAKATLINAITEPDWSVTAEHDGYLRRFGALHRRTVTRRENAILITDSLIGKSRNAELVFQLAEGLIADVCGDIVNVARNGQRLISIEFPRGGISIKSGGDVPGEGGWLSRRFGIRTPAPRIAWQGNVGQDGVTTTIKICEGLHAPGSSTYRERNGNE